MTDIQNPGGWPDGAAYIEFIGEDEHGRRVARLAFPGTLPAVSCDTVWRGEPVLLLTPAEVEALTAERDDGVEQARKAINDADERVTAARREAIEALALKFERMTDHATAALVRSVGAALMETNHE